jgi:hypothetical protein
LFSILSQGNPGCPLANTVIGDVPVVIDRTGYLIDLPYREWVVTLTCTELERIAALVAAVTR